MRVPTAKTPIARCETESIHVQEALTRFPGIFDATPAQAASLNALAGSMRTATAALLASQADYRAAVIGAIAFRVGVKLVDLKADALVRSCKRAADDASADVSAAVFPNGITPIIKPVGQTEVNELHALEGRIQAATSKWPAAGAQLAAIAGIRTAYETALRERAAAATNVGAKRAMRNSVREDFLDVFASVAGALKQTFPRDPKTQDVFFESTREAADDEDEPDDGGDEPATPTGP